VRSEPVNQTVAALNVYSFKTVKEAAGFKFDTRIFRNSPDMNDMILKIYRKGAWSGSRDPKIFGH